MRLKKIFLFGFIPIVLGLFLISFVIAASCGLDDDSQLIMKLNKITNSHGAEWDYDDSTGDYAIEVCHNNNTYGFGKDFELTGFFSTIDPRACGTNLPSGNTIQPFLWLYDNQQTCGVNEGPEYNSHASTKEDCATYYDVPICYGNLICTPKYYTCLPDEKMLLELYDDVPADADEVINSHISIPDNDENIDGAYNTKICCKPGYPTNIYWADMAGNPIIKADLNDLVQLIVKGSWRETEIEYEIEKDTTLTPTVDTGTNKDENFIEGIWNAINTEGLPQDYKFHVNFKGGDWSDYSNEIFASYQGNTLKDEPYTGILTVSTTEHNSPPIANISSPKNGALFVKRPSDSQISINFEQESYDEDDRIVSYEWDFNGDGVLDSTEESASYSYSSIGTKIITLTVEDGRGETNSQSISINIVGMGDSAIAIIKNPKSGENINADTINFDASSSYAINVGTDSSGKILITCLTGTSCPDFTNNDISIDPGTNIPLYYSWIFYDESNTPIYSLSNRLESNADFTFENLGDHNVELTVSITPEETQIDDSTTLEFGTVKYGYCGVGGRVWWDSRGIKYSTIQGWCAEDGICCPYGYDCRFGIADEEEIGVMKCRENFAITTNAQELYSCSNYLHEENCTADPYSLGIAGGGGYGTEFCGVRADSNCAGEEVEITKTEGSCKCVWNENAREGEKCKLQGGGTLIINGEAYEYLCDTTINTGECIEGLMDVTKNSIINWIEKQPPEDCQNLGDLCASSEQDRALCGQARVKLPFFSIFNLIISIFGIALIYIIRINN